MKTSYRISMTLVLLTIMMIHQPFIKNQAFSSEILTVDVDKNKISTTANEFYRWYLHALASNMKPSRDQSHLSRYLSPPLLYKLLHEKAAPDDDYFIKAQDYLEDWESSILVSDVKVGTQAASAMVTLGANASSKHRLVVNFVNDGHAWLISAVRSQGKK